MKVFNYDEFLKEIKSAYPLPAELPAMEKSTETQLIKKPQNDARKINTTDIKIKSRRDFIGILKEIEKISIKAYYQALTTVIEISLMKKTVRKFNELTTGYSK